MAVFAARRHEDSMPAAPVVLGLYSPLAQSGKSTVTRQLAELCPTTTFVNVKISWPLKAPLYAMGLTEAHVEGAEKDMPLAQLGGRSPRDYLIDMAKQMFAHYGPDVLANLAAVRIARELAKGNHVVVDDVRTPDDYAMVRRFGGSEVWRLWRPKPGQVVDTTGARIEGMLEGHAFDLRLDNTGTLADLEDKLRAHLGL
jgi:hypothetical protein